MSYANAVAQSNFVRPRMRAKLIRSSFSQPVISSEPSGYSFLFQLLLAPDAGGGDDDERMGINHCFVALVFPCSVLSVMI